MAAKAKRSGQERVVPVYRNSTELQEDSIERQKSVLIPYAAKRPWKLIDPPVIDEDISGTELERRPGLLKLLAMAKAGEIDGILVDDTSRLTRLDMIDLFYFLKPIRDAGVWIESAATGRWDYTSMIGRVNIGLTTENKHAQAVETGRNTLTAYLRMARDLGKPPLPKTLYGYTRIEDMSVKPNKRGKRPGKWIVNATQAEVVQQIFKWYTQGKALVWMIKELHARAVPSPSGNPLWSATVLRKTLANDAYMGVLYYGKTASGKFWRQRQGEVVPGAGNHHVEVRPREEWMFSEGTHPPIIERDTFDQAQARRVREKGGEFPDGKGGVVVRKRHSTGPTGDPARFILSKLLVCGVCKGWMSGFIAPNATPSKDYMCVNYIAGGKAACVCCRVKEEPMVKRLLSEIEVILSPDRQSAFREMLREKLARNQAADDLKALQKDKRETEKQLDFWRQRLGEVSRDMLSEVEEGIRRCRSRLEELCEKIDQCEQCDPARDLETALEEASKEMWRLRQSLESEDRLLIREALHGIVDHVVVTPVEVAGPGGSKRYKPGGFEVVLRKGTGMALLSNFDHSWTGSVDVREFKFRVSA